MHDDDRGESCQHHPLAKSRQEPPLRTITKGRVRSAQGGITVLSQHLLRRQVAIHNRLPHKSTDSYWNAKRKRDPGYLALLTKISEEFGVDPQTGPAGT